MVAQSYPYIKSCSDLKTSLNRSLPTLFIFVFFQRYFIKGLTLGAVKG